MAWKQGYYYRNRRQNGRVVTEYIGAGPVADLLADQDAAARLQRKTQRERLRRQRAEQDAIDSDIAAVGAALADLVEAALLVNGYHQHKRQWRRKYGRIDDTSTDAGARIGETVAGSG